MKYSHETKMRKNKYYIYYFEIIYSRLMRKIVLSNEFDEHKNYYRKRRYYCGKKVLIADEANKKLENLLNENKPMACGRFGSVELYATGVFDLAIKEKYENASRELHLNAGFFSDKSEKRGEREFSQLMKECMGKMDFLGIWNIPFEHYYLNKIKKDVSLTYLRYLEPWFSEYPWTKALKGKSVLVIHPYAETIEKQYAKREKLFCAPDILPEFQLHTLKAVQSMGGECETFDTWFDALDWMTEEALKIDFDVALIGCGAYGMPLATRIKDAGRKAIHMGGVLQILFGIRGKRWDTDPVVSKLYNDSWIRPDDKDKPKVADEVEGGCYW